MLEEQFEWERAKSLTDPRLDLITDEFGNLYSSRYVGDEEANGPDKGALPGVVIPFETEMEGAPQVGPSFHPWGPPMGPPPESMQKTQPGFMVPDPSDYDPWGPPMGPPPEFMQKTQPGFMVPDESQYEPQTAQPGPADEEMWPHWYFPDPTDLEDERWENIPGEGEGMGRGDILPDPRGGWEEPGRFDHIPEPPWEGKSPDLIPGEWGGTEGLMAIVPLLAISVVMGLMEKKGGII